MGRAGARCAVRGCDVALHSFPSDPFQRAMWMEWLGHVMPEDSTEAYICSAHFEEDCFALTGRLLGCAVPTVRHPQQNPAANAMFVTNNLYNLKLKVEPLQMNEPDEQALDSCQNELKAVKNSLIKQRSKARKRLTKIKALRERCAQLEHANMNINRKANMEGNGPESNGNFIKGLIDKSDISEMSVDVCQVCLVTGVRLHHIDSVLRQRLQSLMGVQGETHTRYVCYECFALLRKFDALRGKSHRAQFVLSAISQVVRTVTTKTIIGSVDRTQCRLVSNLTIKHCDEPIDVVHGETEERATPVVKNEEMLELFVDDDNFRWDANSEHDYASISDDSLIRKEEVVIANEFVEVNIPMTIPVKLEEPNEVPPVEPIKTTPKKIPISNTVRMKRKKSKDGYVLVTKTYEEAMAEMREKRDSAQYQNSKYKCELCYRGYSMRSAYDNHMVFHDPGLKMECDFCHVRFSKRKGLSHHMSGYHGYMYHCKKCSYVTTTRSLMLRHKQGHVVKTHQCKLCDMKFNCQSTLMSHMFNKHDRNYVCDLCGKDFVNEHGIRSHKYLMHVLDKDTDTSKGPRCDPCRVQFASREALQRHLIVSSKHNRDNISNGCEVCLEKFSSRAALKEHEKSHRDKRIYNKVSIAKPEYQPKEKGSKKKRHIEWPIQCDKCETLFYTGIDHWRHYKAEHPGVPRPEIVEKNYVCDICGIRRPTKATLTQHKLRHQEKQFRCTECPKTFAFRITLTRHMALHTGDLPFACHLCGKQFNNQGNMKRHLNVHMGVRYKCDYCDKVFTQTSARVKHIQYVHLKNPYPKRDRNKRTNSPRASGHSTRRIAAVYDPRDDAAC